MAYPPVPKQIVTGNFGSSASARTLVLGTVTAGDAIIVAVGTFNAAITLTVSDNVNAGNYTQLGSYATNGNTIVSIWYMLNTGAGSPTVSILPSAAAFMGCAAIEISSVNTSSAGDGSNQATGSSASFTTGNVTQTDSFALAIAAWASTSTLSSFVPTAPLLLAMATPNAGTALAFIVALGVTTGTTNLTLTANASVAFAAAGGTLKITQPAGGGGGGGNLLGNGTLVAA